jgi:hypothetical protein
VVVVDEELDWAKAGAAKASGAKPRPAASARRPAATHERIILDIQY